MLRNITLKQKNSTHENFEDVNKRFLENITEDMRIVTSAYLDSSDLVNKSMCCKTFYSEQQNYCYWQEKLIAAGCNKELLEYVHKIGVINNYKNLYRAFTKLNFFYRLLISQAWELLCLSGSIPAILHAIKHENLTAQSSNIRLDNQLVNALFYTVLSGNVDAVVEHVKHLKMETCLSKMNQNHALTFAVLSGKTTMINYIIELMKIPSCRVTHNYELLYFAIMSGEDTCLNHTAKLVGNLEFKNNDGMNLLHWAANKGKLSFCKWVLEKIGSDCLNKETKNGETALHFAAKSGNKNTLQFFHQNNQLKATLTKAGKGVVHYAAESGNIEVVKYALDELKNNPATPDLNGFTALHRAAFTGHTNIMKFFIEVCGIKPTIQSKDGNTILHAAVLGNNPAAVEYARSLGLDPRKINKAGNNAFMLAEKSHNKEKIKASLHS